MHCCDLLMGCGCPGCCRYGYKGFYDRRHKPIVLTRKVVEGIQLAGGTILVGISSLHSMVPFVLLQWGTLFFVCVVACLCNQWFGWAQSEVSRHDACIDMKRFDMEAVQKECNMAGVHESTPICSLSPALRMISAG